MVTICKMKRELALPLAATIRTAEEEFADPLFSTLEEQLLWS